MEHKINKDDLIPDLSNIVNEYLPEAYQWYFKWQETGIPPKISLPKKVPFHEESYIFGSLLLYLEIFVIDDKPTAVHEIIELIKRKYPYSFVDETISHINDDLTIAVEHEFIQIVEILINFYTYLSLFPIQREMQRKIHYEDKRTKDDLHRSLFLMLHRLTGEAIKRDREDIMFLFLKKGDNDTSDTMYYKTQYVFFSVIHKNREDIFMKLQNKGFYCTYLDMLTIIHEGRINLLKLIDIENTPELLPKINDLIRDNRSSGDNEDVKMYLEHIRDAYKMTK